VEVCDCAYTGAEGRVRGHVGDPLAVQQHRPSIPQPAHIVVATSSHTAPSLCLWSARPPYTRFRVVAARVNFLASRFVAKVRRILKNPGAWPGRASPNM